MRESTNVPSPSGGRAVAGVVGNLVSSSGSLDNTASKMRTLAGDASRKSAAVAEAAQPASADVQTVASAAGTRNVTQTIGRVASIGAQSGEAAETLAMAVGQMTEGMDRPRGEMRRFLETIRANWRQLRIRRRAAG